MGNVVLISFLTHPIFSVFEIITAFLNYVKWFVAYEVTMCWSMWGLYSRYIGFIGYLKPLPWKISLHHICWLTSYCHPFWYYFFSSSPLGSGYSEFRGLSQLCEWLVIFRLHYLSCSSSRLYCWSWTFDTNKRVFWWCFLPGCLLCVQYMTSTFCIR